MSPLNVMVFISRTRKIARSPSYLVISLPHQGNCLAWNRHSPSVQSLQYVGLWYGNKHGFKPSEV